MACSWFFIPFMEESRQLGQFEARNLAIGFLQSLCIISNRCVVVYKHFFPEERHDIKFQISAQNLQFKNFNNLLNI